MGARKITGVAGRPVGRRALFTRLASVARDAIRDAQAPAARLGPAERSDGADSTPPPVARVQPAACIAYRGTMCTVCSERCPEPGAIVTEMGRPRVIAGPCTGCGECVARCPAPVVAITLVER